MILATLRSIDATPLSFRRGEHTQFFIASQFPVKPGKNATHGQNRAHQQGRQSRSARASYLPMACPGHRTREDEHGISVFQWAAIAEGAAPSDRKDYLYSAWDAPITKPRAYFRLGLLPVLYLSGATVYSCRGEFTSNPRSH